MAVVDKYTNTNAEAGKLYNPAFVRGSEAFGLQTTFEVAAADDDGSVYRVFKDLNPNLIPHTIEIYNDAITSGTDYDLGLYEPNYGAAIDIDKLAATLDMSSGAAKGSPKDGLKTVGLDEMEEKLYELAGHTIETRKAAYDIAFTANTVGSGAGTISVRALFIQG